MIVLASTKYKSEACNKEVDQINRNNEDNHSKSVLEWSVKKGLGHLTPDFGLRFC